MAGIVFLAFEVQQNNVLLESQAKNTRMDLRRSAYSLQIENPELRRISGKNRAGDFEF
jgi:hypothetical protein